MLPLAKPATVLATLLVFVGAWSDYLLSLIMINSAKNYTMQLRIAQFMNQYGVDHMPRYAASHHYCGSTNRNPVHLWSPLDYPGHTGGR